MIMEKNRKNYGNQPENENFNNNYNDVDDDDEQPCPDDMFNEMSWDKDPYESDEDYMDRMQDLNDLLENLS